MFIELFIRVIVVKFGKNYSAGIYVYLLFVFSLLVQCTGFKVGSEEFFTFSYVLDCFCFKRSGHS